MNNTQKKSYVLPIAMMFALFFMIGFVTNLANPFGVIVKTQFGASNFMSQLGNAANFLAYLFMGIPAGILLGKIGYKKSALLAIIIGIVGLGIMYISGQVESFAVYVFGAFVAGFCMCILNAVVNPMLNTLGKNEKQGNQFLQFGGAFNSIAATLVPIIVGYLMGSNEATRNIAKANPALFLGLGVFVVAFLVLYFVSIPEPHLVKEKKTEKDSHSALSFNHFRMGMIAIFIYVGVEVGLSHPTNVFMTTGVSEGGLGIDPTIAGTVVGTYWFLMMCGRLLGGLVGGKMSSRTMLTGVASLGIVFVLLGIFLPVSTYVDMPVFRSNISFGLENIPINIMFFVLGGLCTSVMWGSIFNLATSGLGKYTAQASGLFMMMVVGGGVLPLLQGLIADKASFLSSYWVIFGGMAYILFFALIGSRNINKDIAVE